MAIDKMNEHYSFTNPASIYDEEALTALELAGRQAKKINEVVDAQNNLDKKTNETLHRFEEATIPAEVEDTVNKYIENGTFNEAVSEHLDGLNERVDTLLGSVTVGSTTMDAEIIDGRYNEVSGLSATTLRTNLQALYKDSLSIRNTPADPDADNLLTAGLYWVSSGVEWKHVPVFEDTGYPIGGHLIVLNDSYTFKDTITFAHTYQLFLGADGNLYFRAATPNGNFWEWVKFSNEAEYIAYINNVLEPVKRELNNNTLSYRTNKGVDVNVDFEETGFYFISSSVTHTNLPEGENAGMLATFKGLNAYTSYQLFYSFTGKLYIRNKNIDTTYKPWVRMATADDIKQGGGTPSKRYTIHKVDDRNFYIMDNRGDNSIKYDFGVDGTGENTRLTRVWKVNNQADTSKLIVDIGHDIEGVLYLDGDFYGGCHGNEIIESIKIVVDGVLYTDIPTSMEADNIRIFRASSLRRAGLQICYVQRSLYFYNGEIEVGCQFDGQDIYAAKMYGGMLSAYKNCCPYHSSDINPFVGGNVENMGELTLSTDNNTNITRFFGNGVDCSIEVKTSHSEYQMVDYGDRYKAYYINELVEIPNGPIGVAKSFMRSILKFN